MNRPDLIDPNMDNHGGVSTIGFRSTTTTTTTRSTVVPDSGSFINYRYFMRVQGCLKFVQLLFGIICISTATPPILDGSYFFLFVCYSALFATFVWIIIIFFRIESKVGVNPSWPVLELVYTGGAFGLYALATTVQFTIWSPVYILGGYNPKPRAICAAVFGLFNCIAYAVGAFYAFRNWRSIIVTSHRNGQTTVY